MTDCESLGRASAFVCGAAFFIFVGYGLTTMVWQADCKAGRNIFFNGKVYACVEKEIR